MNYIYVVQEELEHERGLRNQHSQEVQDRLSEELEVAISTWKQAMKEEVARAKEISEGVDKENLRQRSGFSTPLDLENYFSQVNYLSFSIWRSLKWCNLLLEFPAMVSVISFPSCSGEMMEMYSLKVTILKMLSHICESYMYRRKRN